MKQSTPKPRREKSIEERAIEGKTRIKSHLEDIARHMDELAAIGVEVSFNIGRTPDGGFAVNTLIVSSTRQF